MIFVCNSNVNCDRHIKKRYLREKDDHAFFSHFTFQHIHFFSIKIHNLLLTRLSQT